jgi:hypothetical protein
MENKQATVEETAEVSVNDESTQSPEVEMCCDGSGRTAEQHRAESPDHKCCVDS